MSFCTFKFLRRSVFLLLCVLCLFISCVPSAYAVESDSSAVESTVISEVAEEETTAEETTEEEAEPVEGEITDAQFKAYVLGCLSFFVAVILFYFSYKFLRMFF